jgi:hypothetical protein
MRSSSFLSKVTNNKEFSVRNKDKHVNNSYCKIHQQKVSSQQKDSNNQKVSKQKNGSIERNDSGQRKESKQRNDPNEQKDLNQQKGPFLPEVDSYKHDFDGWKDRQQPYDFPKSVYGGFISGKGIDKYDKIKNIRLVINVGTINTEVLETAAEKSAHIGAFLDLVVREPICKKRVYASGLGFTRKDLDKTFGQYLSDMGTHISILVLNVEMKIPFFF